MYGSLNVAVEGCCHGELDSIYDTIRETERRGIHVDLLLVCGDFECVRDYVDLECVAVPQKYRKLNTFHDYVTGKKTAPVTTIFIGGNHEASNILQNLYYGGWVAPNIYFLGFAGVVWFGGIRIAGCSGIYNEHHYFMGHFEKPPYDNSGLRSVYHLREIEILRLLMVHGTGPIDIFISHDWPEGITNFGDLNNLLRKKPFLADDITSKKLGSPPLMHILKTLQPALWFAAHLHTKFAAIIPHHPTESELQNPHQTTPTCIDISPGAGDRSCNTTRFLSLDKVLPGRDFLQIVKVNRWNDSPCVLQFDPVWLAILRRTHTLCSTSTGRVRLPSSLPSITDEEVQWVVDRLNAVSGGQDITPMLPTALPSVPHPLGSPETDMLLEMLQLSHIWTVPFRPPQAPVDTHTSRSFPAVRPVLSGPDPNELSISDEESDPITVEHLKAENDSDWDTASLLLQQQSQVDGSTLKFPPPKIAVIDDVNAIDIDDL